MGRKAFLVFPMIYIIGKKENKIYKTMAIQERIFQEIKKADRILLPLHLHPDGDSIGSTLAFCYVLNKWQKEALPVSSDPPPENFSFLPLINKVKHIDFTEIDLSKFDLIIALDNSSLSRFTNKKLPAALKNFSIVNIDHHLTNTKFGQVNLILPKKTSTCEILYDLFIDWQIEIDETLATLLCFGIFTDTGCFRFPNTTSDVFRKTAKLLDLGAPLSEFVFQTFRGLRLKTLKYYGKVLENMKTDEKHKFVWSAVPYEEFKQLDADGSEIQGAANLFCQSVAETKFGLILDERESDVVCGSLRSRTGFDVSKIAKALGGGGHKLAAGFRLEMPLDKAEKKVLSVARRVSKERV